MIGHSTGGMLAVRYALMFPPETERLVLVDPIGLEDWQAKGVPSPTVDEWTRGKLKTLTAERSALRTIDLLRRPTGAGLRTLGRMLAGLDAGPGQDASRGLGADRRHDLHAAGGLRISADHRPDAADRDKDTTAIGKDFAPKDVQAKLGIYAELAPRTKAAIPGAELVEFPDAGHAPQIQEPEEFNAALIEGLAETYALRAGRAHRRLLRGSKQRPPRLARPCPGHPRRDRAPRLQNACAFVCSGRRYSLVAALLVPAWMTGTSPVMTDGVARSPKRPIGTSPAPPINAATPRYSPRSARDRP